MTFRVLIQIEELIDNSFLPILGLKETSKSVGGIHLVLADKYEKALKFIDKIKGDLGEDYDKNKEVDN